MRSQLKRASHILAVAYDGDAATAFTTIQDLGAMSSDAMVVAQACPRPADASPKLSLLLAETRRPDALIGHERSVD